MDWDLIKQDYLTSPYKRGLIKELAHKHGVSYQGLRQRMHIEGWQPEKDSLVLQFPIEKALKQKLNQRRLAGNTAVSIVKNLERDLVADGKKHNALMAAKVFDLHRDIDESEKLQDDIMGRMSAIEKLDQIARRTFNLGSGEVDQNHRGIALLIGGYDPKPVQGRVVQDT